MRHAHHGSAVHTCPGARCAPRAPRGRHPRCRRALGCQITPNHGAEITHPNFCLNWKRGQSLGHSLARAGHRMGCGHWVQFAYKPFDLITLGPKMRSSAWVVQARIRAQVPLPWAAGGCGDPQQTQTATGPLEMHVEGQDRARGSGWRGLGRAAGCGAGKAPGPRGTFVGQLRSCQALGPAIPKRPAPKPALRPTVPCLFAFVWVGLEGVGGRCMVQECPKQCIGREEAVCVCVGGGGVRNPKCCVPIKPRINFFGIASVFRTTNPGSHGGGGGCPGRAHPMVVGRSNTALD